MNGSMIFGLILLYLIIAAVLAIIPLNIANAKGYGSKAWWVYGFFAWPFAIIHIACLPNRNTIKVIIDTPAPDSTTLNVTEEIDKYRELYEEGVISEEEFEAKRKQFLTI